ncbi:MAG: hypothetical protein KBS91_02445 [Firmicutes bacterium]|nr:hypothetical protein [Candidatus Caballimonas caccae]
MSNFWNLLKIQLITNLRINKIKQKNKRGKTAGYSALILYAILICGAFFFFGSTYTEIYATSLILFNKVEETIPLIIALSGLVSLLFSFYSMSAVLYNFKDYDMLASMPIKRREIVFSKVIYSYITDLALSLFLVIGCLYKTYSMEEFVSILSAVYVLKVIFITILTPLFALSISIIIGTLFSLISSKFKRKNLAQIILYLLAIGGYLALTISSSSENVDFTKTIGKVFFIYPWLNNAINNDAIFIIYYLLACVLSFSLITFVVCIFFKQLNSIMTAKKTSRSFKLKTYERKGKLKTLLQKELRRLFSSPLYFMNCLLGVVFIVIIVVVGLIVITSIDFIDILELSGLIVFAPIIMSFFLMLSPTTACSIAVEGKNLWIYKTSPIAPKDFFLAKLLVNAIFYLPASLVLSVALVAVMKIEFIVSFLFVLLSILIASFSGAFGLFANILFPHLSWENENQAVKQGIAVLLTVLSSFIFSALFFVCAYYIEISVLWLFLIETIFMLILNVVLYTLIFTKGDKILDKRSKS